MTTLRKYECNLCRESVPVETPAADAPGYSVRFDVAGEWLQLGSPPAAENHICGKCLAALRALGTGKP